MPFKRKYTKKSKKVVKKTYKKNIRRKYSSALVPRIQANIGLGLPSSLKATMKYNETITIASTTGFLSNYHFCANGLYDPNLSGAGHQPMFFDTIMPLYTHYRVIGSKITVKFFQTPTYVAVPMQVCVWQNDDTSSSAADIMTVIESSKSKNAALVSGTTPKTLTLGFSSSKTYGRGIFANDELRGGIGNNPLEQAIFTISAQTADRASNSAVYCIVEIEYVVIFNERKEGASS